jgi:hypothetical protein
LENKGFSGKGEEVLSLAQIRGRCESNRNGQKMFNVSFWLGMVKSMLLEQSENIRAAALGAAVDACERLQPDSHLVAVAKFLAKGGEESGLLTKSGVCTTLRYFFVSERGL